MDRKVLKYCGKMISAVAKRVAERDANTCCPYITYQPNIPDAVKKLKKN